MDNNSFAIFSPVSSHSDVAQKLFGKPVSAGFCKISSQYDRERDMIPVVKCFGDSFTLNLGSRPVDGEIITKQLNREY